MQSPSRRPAPLPARPLPPLGLTPDPQSLRQWQAQRYHFGALRRLGPAPAPLPAGPRPMAAARDGDLARVDARVRYERQLVARQQYLAQHPRPLPQAYMSAPEYAPDYEQQQVQRRLEQQHAQLVADHPLEATVGEGVVIGSNIVTSTLLSEVAAARLLTGARWLGATRAGLAVRATTGRATAALGADFSTLGGAARNLTFGQAENGLFGVRAGWQDIGNVKLLMGRGAIDAVGQGSVNYATSKYTGWDRVLDAAGGINLVETGASAYGIRPFGVGVFSSAFQYSYNDGYRSVLNQRISWSAFAAQAAIGTSVGYLGEYGGRVLKRPLLYSLYSKSAQRFGYDIGHPLWVGGNLGVPIGFGALASYYQAGAQTQWPGTPAVLPDSLAH